VNNQDPLAQLKEIHLPEAVGLWPLAPGWWIVLLLVLAALLTTALWLRRRRRASAYRGAALAALSRLERSDASHYLQQLNLLLKQTALAAGSEQHVASLSGEPWLQFLDLSLGDNSFSCGAGAVLASGPYTAQTTFDSDALEALAQRWIKHHKNVTTPC